MKIKSIMSQSHKLMKNMFQNVKHKNVREIPKIQKSSKIPNIQTLSSKNTQQSQKLFYQFKIQS